MTQPVLIVVAVWFLIALGAGILGLTERMVPPVPQAVLISLTLSLLVLIQRAERFRAWLMSIDARWLVAIHLTRFVGIYFLLLHRKGLLPYDFAVKGGWGDIAVASTALVLLATLDPSRSRIARMVYFGWNAFGLADIVFVVTTAIVAAMHDPISMVLLTRLPLSLLPTFLVPIIILSHLVLLTRFSRHEPAR
jgi:hypothetical protein